MGLGPLIGQRITMLSRRIMSTRHMHGSEVAQKNGHVTE